MLIEPPGSEPTFHNVDVGRFAGNGRVATQQTDKFGQHLDEDILAAEVSHDALFYLAAFAEGLDDADILVDGAIGGRDFEDAWVHVVIITTVDGKAMVLYEQYST